jgi:adenylate cyclase
MDFITVKGKTEPETVYTILGGADVAHSDRFQRIHHAIGEMLACYRQRDFDGAGKSIVRCREADDGFGLENIFDLYTARLETFRQTPPPADWNGAFVLETK